MIKQIKIFLKQRALIKDIEQALGFKLYDWQIEYILTGSEDSRPVGRQTGATTAYIIRLLLDQSTPIICNGLPDRCHHRNYPDGYAVNTVISDRPEHAAYTSIFANEVIKMANIFEENHIPCRKVFRDEYDFESAVRAKRYLDEGNYKGGEHNGRFEYKSSKLIF